MNGVKAGTGRTAAGKGRKPPRAPWKKQQPDSAKLDALLDAAAAEFNARGIAGARLGAIAEAVGVGRAALYYYVDSREELALRCYARACTTTAADLAFAAHAATGLKRLQSWLALALDPKRAPAVVLSEIPYLGGARRAQVEALHGANLEALQAFVEAGIADGSIRNCDAHVVAQAIFGMVSWVALAEEYVAGSGASVRQHAAEALADVITNGTAADPARDFRCPHAFSQFLEAPGNLFDRASAKAHKVDLLLQSATRLFNRQGIDGTSLDQLTAELGATKGAFYQYIPQKGALVVQCVERGLDFYERFVEAAAHGRDGFERVMIGLHLNVQAQASEQAPLSPLTGLSALPAPALRRIRKRTSALEARFESFGREGMADGTLRRYDVRTMALAGAGAFGWIPKWYDPAGGPPAAHVADEMVALIAHGLRKRKHP